jgi:hypothetical protein
MSTLNCASSVFRQTDHVVSLLVRVLWIGLKIATGDDPSGRRFGGIATLAIVTRS